MAIYQSTATKSQMSVASISKVASCDKAPWLETSVELDVFGGPKTSCGGCPQNHKSPGAPLLDISVVPFYQGPFCLDSLCFSLS